jgi:hypothetical protein
MAAPAVAQEEPPVAQEEPPVAQEEPQPATLDIIDIWNHIRNKPEADGGGPQPTSMKAIAPVIGAKPSSGFTAGVAGNIAFFNGDPRTTHISSVVASLTFSAKDQTAMSARFAMLTRDDGWRIEGDNRAQWTSQDTYSLGTSSDQQALTNARFDFFRVHETVYRRVSSGIFLGGGLHYDNHQKIGPGADVSDAEWQESAPVQYSAAHDMPADRQVSGGISADALIDTRDSAIDPRRGWLASASYRALFDGFLGGTTSWQLLHVETRSYANLDSGHRQRLAFWLFGDAILNGTAPYFDLPATAMDSYGRSGRGYGEGRFRGERLLYGETEYRGTLTSNGLLGMVAFLNLTTVTNLQLHEHLFDSVAPGAGAGLRVLINKRSRTNLCFDVGFGKDGSHGVYLNVQEAF